MASEFELLFKLQASLGNKFKDAFNSAKKVTTTLDKDLAKLQNTSKNIDSFNRLSNQLNGSKTKLEQQKKALEELNAKLKESGGNNDKLTEKLRKQDEAIAKTKEKIQKESKSLAELKTKLEEAKVNTSNLSGEKERLAKEVEKVAKANEKLKNIATLQTENQAAIKSTKKELLKTTGAISAAFGGVMAATGKVAGSLDRVDKLSQKIGISRTAFQEWDYILGQCGADIQGLKTGMKTLNGRMHEAAKGSGTGAEALKKLNVSVKNTDGSMRKQEEVFADVVKKLNQMPEGAQKSQSAFELFGKAGLELMPMLNSTGDTVEDLRKKAHELGLVMTDEAVDSGVLFGDTMDDLKKTLGGLIAQVLTVFMPAIIKGAEKLTQITAAAAKFAKEHPKLIKLIGMLAVGLASAKVATLGLKLGFLNMKGGALGVWGVFQKMKALNLAGNLGKFGKLLGGLTGKFTLIVAAIGLVIGVIRILAGNADAVREKLRETFGDGAVAVFDKFLEAVKGISEIIKKAFSGKEAKAFQDLVSKFKAGGPVAEALKKTFDRLMEALPKIIDSVAKFAQAILPTLINVLSTVINVISELIAAILPILLDLFNALLPVIQQLASQIFPVLADIINTVVAALLPLIKAILPILVELLNTLTPVIGFLSTAFAETLGVVIENIKTQLQHLLTIFQGIIDFITGVFTGDWSKAWDGVVKVFGSIWDTLGALVKANINGIIKLVNIAIRGLNKLKVPDWVPAIGGSGVNIPEIPLLAKGSSHTPDTFIAGEKGPELITGSAGKRVFTAGQTSSIFGRVKEAYQSAREKATVNTPRLAVAGGGSTSIVVNSSPVFHIANGNPEEIDAKLRASNERLKREIKNELLDEAEDKRRRRYD